MKGQIRTPFDLPIVKRKERKNTLLFQQKLLAVIKRQAVKVVMGETVDFLKDVSSVAESIWQDGYSKGLRDMDRMHSKVNLKT